MLRLHIRTKFIFMGAIGFFTLASIVILAYNMGRLGIDSIDRVFKDSKNVQPLQQDFLAPVFTHKSSLCPWLWLQTKIFAKICNS
mgnify:CR=1 FL=1